ncbi:hypothetical protein GCM10025868_09910 [Angustibacter aerolatus]|uniref:ABC transporter domain-containing protein n=1 Tax=Angustibacter aerolatus TaxID=1162965 RepID=A0ABQ6JDT4_9ACTN|nr:ATP-binding cassette domain-containing protein [Angustibacter aerolatus]GMA85741.1 hypothetical protein GCM10025868_09910 [Angustibacter aerolatus]
MLQNMALGQWDRGPARLLTWRALRTRAKEVLGTLGLEVPLDTPAEHLSIADAWLVSIGRALVHRARLVAMDEPSASLSAQECRRLFGVVRRLAAGGVSVLYVSHRLDEVVDLCQTVTVFRDGRVVERLEGAAITRPALVRGIVGGEHVPAAAEASGRAPAADVEPALRVRGLQRAPLVRGVDLDVLPGEVVGLTGLVGSGRTEVARMVFGADQPDAGAMWIDGRRHAPRDVVAGIRAGVALVPEERRSQALFLQRSIDFNVNLPTMASTRTGPLRLLSPRRRRDRAEGMVRQARIKTRSTQEPVQHLSGGNQQKVVMAKWLVGSCRVLLLDEPSRGVDVSARTEIYRVIREQAAAGTAVLVISSEYDEPGRLRPRRRAARGPRHRRHPGGGAHRVRRPHRVVRRAAARRPHPGERMTQTTTSTAAGAAVAEPVSARSPGKVALAVAGKYGTIIGLAVMIVALSIAAPGTFLSVSNFTNVLTQNSLIAIVACGLTLPLVVGEFDLSIGYQAAFAGVLCVGLMSDQGQPLWLAVVVGLLVGVVAGLVNGLLVTVLDVNALIATLGIGTVIVGVNYAYTGGIPKTLVGHPHFLDLALGKVAGIPNPIVFMALAVGLLWLLLNRTVLGQQMQAVGGNAEAARLSGVRVQRVRVWAFVIAGLMAAVGGVLLSSRVGSGR